ncbi:uncharacterized protein LOC120162692 [Hibiscus syriacus]|uniref:uncharacterized protein LOC120162692 n=1 Tax=Hibiscus syriacus TaxID=106335 RepID=UPI0019243A5C|nr:uncharacterized protein LOC120162692 [Hibiscus syriacus]
MASPHDFSNSNSLVVNNNMPTKQATRCERKTVFVTVCVEKPRRRAPYRYVHHTIMKQQLIQQKLGGADKGYDRRAQLLLYSRRLRESARSSTFKALQSKPVSSTDHQKPSNKIVGVQRKVTHCRTPGCFDKWRVMVPCCLTNLQAKKSGKNRKDESKTSNTMIKAIMKSLQVQKKRRFFSKPIPLMQKNQHL